MRMTIAQYTRPGETYARTAFADQVGTQIRIKIDGEGSILGKLISAEVAESGSTVLLTFEVNGEVVGRAGGKVRLELSDGA